MVVRQPRYSKEEIAWRGDRIYETQVRPQVEAVHHGKIVASVCPESANRTTQDTPDRH